MITAPDIRPHQIWADRDRRQPHRRITVTAADPHGWVDGESWREGDPALRRPTRIRYAQFPARFRLVQDAPTAEETTR